MRKPFETKRVKFLKKKLSSEIFLETFKVRLDRGVPKCGQFSHRNFVKKRRTVKQRKYRS